MIGGALSRFGAFAADAFGPSAGQCRLYAIRSGTPTGHSTYTIVGFAGARWILAHVPMVHGGHLTIVPGDRDCIPTHFGDDAAVRWPPCTMGTCARSSERQQNLLIPLLLFFAADERYMPNFNFAYGIMLVFFGSGLKYYCQETHQNKMKIIFSISFYLTCILSILLMSIALLDFQGIIKDRSPIFYQTLMNLF